MTSGVTRLGTFVAPVQELPDGEFRLSTALFGTDPEIRRRAMSLTMQTHEEIRASLQLNFPEGARILIVCDNDSDTKRLRTLLMEAGFASDCAKSIATACEAAKSGLFQVVVSIPQLRDGSWKRLTEIAHHYDLHFEVVLWAHNFDLREWAEALEDGAFDVLDAVNELPSVVQVIKAGLWAAYLKGAGPQPRATCPPRAA
jgi:PleD family two-component response regulator